MSNVKLPRVSTPEINQVIETIEKNLNRLNTMLSSLDKNQEIITQLTSNKNHHLYLNGDGDVEVKIIINNKDIIKINSSGLVLGD